MCVRSALAKITHGGFAGVVGIEEYEVDGRHRLQGLCECVVDVAADGANVVGVMFVEKYFCEGV